jgi:hypothetical protein
MVTPGRFELPTRSLGNCCSIHLSYGATFKIITGMLSLCHLENTALQLRLPRLQKLPNGGTGMRIAAAQSDAINRVAFRSSKRSRASSGVPGNSQMTEVELDARNWRTTWELWQIGVSFVAQVFDSDLAGEEPVCSQIPQE